MKKVKKVLIFPAGTEIAFEIVNALKYSKFVELYGGTSTDDHSEFVYKKLIKGFPFVSREGFLEYLNRVIDEYEIDCIYPAHDAASAFLSENADKIHAQVIISEPETTKICGSKKLTYEYFKDEEFIPKTYPCIDDVVSYPVFVKPAVGHSSIGARQVKSRDELTMALSKDDSLVICEYLSGSEYTVDCFTDKNGRLLVTKLRDRQRIRAGISVRSKEYNPDDEILRIANTLNDRLKFKGAWFFQVKKNDENKYRLLEISPRIPGTMGLSRNLGINFPLLTLFTFWNYDVSIIDNGYDIMTDRAFYSAYKADFTYDHVYVDFDDVIIIKGSVNADIMRFIYQAKNSGKKIHIISRHDGNIFEDLRKYCISENLFESIVVISRDDEKFNYMQEKNAIFIDDSFAERKKVHDILGIPVFDVDTVESLIDRRM